MSGLKKALLLYLAEVTGDAKQICLSALETIFDLLLALPDICAAVQLVQKAIDQYPEKKYLLYLLGQAQWRDGNQSEAKVNYVRACLLHPDETFRKRIEINGAKIQPQQCGIAWLPAYGWLYGTLPMMPLHEEATYVNKDHKQAANVYRLLVLSEKAAQKNDLRTSVGFRKEIKAIKPDLYHAYFRLLQQRKSLLILTPPIK